MPLGSLKSILISRTDSLGDVTLTLPLVGYLKSIDPGVHIVFLGSSYAQPLVDCCGFVDEFVNYTSLKQLPLQEQVDEIAKLNVDAVLHVFPVAHIARLMKSAKVPVRIGTFHRAFHWFTCNRFVSFSRKKSELHESQLNFKLLRGLGINFIPRLIEIPAWYGLKPKDQVPDWLAAQLDSARFKLILHPKSKGSAREWGLDHFVTLTKLLPKDRFQLIVSGTAEEGEQMQPLFAQVGELVLNVTGKLSLSEFIALIAASDGIVAASTGPLHISAALGKKALGLFAPMKPIHPGRWKPVGAQADFLVIDKDCNDCRKGGVCACILALEPNQVAEWFIGK